METEFTVKNPLTGKNEKMELQDSMILALVKRVQKNGDSRAFDSLMDSGHGKLPTKAIHNFTPNPEFKTILADILEEDITEEDVPEGTDKQS
ncbi:hypothetical protein EHQ53_14100 [Leptospira langatensis]|uniref:Uncharacterized protein n=1 Tax=Leptospira langatensis TaxID=2484983 RepID=A0ABY2MB13_9LEPT|nr:hypothetical protein EHQ53_14100 [Leptospira langatensis]